RDTVQPVEKNKPNANYKPAFAGQTRVSGVTTKSAFQFNILTSQLKSPWDIAQLPDGRLLITEKEGVMRIVNSTGNISARITGLLNVDARAQVGLLGLVLNPVYATIKMV